MTRGLRMAGALAMALAIAQCGDSNDVRISTGRGIAPSPGTFTGSLSDGGSITIGVGSIESVTFDCDDETISETFTPPREIDDDGSFSVGFSDGGREFRVEGQFRDNSAVDGTINDEDNECDVSFEAFRGGPERTPTPTPTTGGSATAPTSTPDTSPIVTATPTPTPTATTGTPVTPVPSPCPVAVEVLGNAGASKILDSGWSGLAHNATVVSDGKLTFTVSNCENETKPCGDCEIGGPIQNANAGAGDIDAQRCVQDTSITCDAGTPCPSGACAFFFGAPLPLSAGGIGTCVTNQVNGAVTGTGNAETGEFTGTINLTSRVHSGIETNRPCPTCDGDGTANDGTKGGTCSGGSKVGQACDVSGESPTPSFGSTSLDCPPSGLISALTITLAGSSGTETRTLAASSPNCTAFGATSKKCLCPPQGSEPNAPNACLDDSATIGTDEGLCSRIGSTNEGQCTAVADLACSPTETFRGCTTNQDCPVSGDSCIAVNRPCYLDNGVVGGSVSAVGKADPADANGRAEPTFAALFCIPPVAQTAINRAGGLPGLGRIELPLIGQELYELPTP